METNSKGALKVADLSDRDTAYSQPSQDSSQSSVLSMDRESVPHQVIEGILVVSSAINGDNNLREVAAYLVKHHYPYSGDEVLMAITVEFGSNSMPVSMMLENLNTNPTNEHELSSDDGMLQLLVYGWNKRKAYVVRHDGTKTALCDFVSSETFLETSNLRTDKEGNLVGVCGQANVVTILRDGRCNAIRCDAFTILSTISKYSVRMNNASSKSVNANLIAVIEELIVSISTSKSRNPLSATQKGRLRAALQDTAWLPQRLTVEKMEIEDIEKCPPEIRIDAKLVKKIRKSMEARNVPELREMQKFVLLSVWDHDRTKRRLLPVDCVHEVEAYREAQSSQIHTLTPKWSFDSPNSEFVELESEHVYCGWIEWTRWSTVFNEEEAVLHWRVQGLRPSEKRIRPPYYVCDRQHFDVAAEVERLVRVCEGHVDSRTFNYGNGMAFGHFGNFVANVRRNEKMELGVSDVDTSNAHKESDGVVAAKEEAGLSAHEGEKGPAHDENVDQAKPFDDKLFFLLDGQPVRACRSKSAKATVKAGKAMSGENGHWYVHIGNILDECKAQRLKEIFFDNVQMTTGFSVNEDEKGVHRSIRLAFHFQKTAMEFKQRFDEKDLDGRKLRVSVWRYLGKKGVCDDHNYEKTSPDARERREKVRIVVAVVQEGLIALESNKEVVANGQNKETRDDGGEPEKTRPVEYEVMLAPRVGNNSDALCTRSYRR